MRHMNHLIAIIVLILLTACGTEQPGPSSATAAAQPSSTATAEPISSPSPTSVEPAIEEMEPTSTSEPTAAPTKGLTGPRATALALANAVTFNPVTRASGEEELDDSYLGVFERAWWLVQENYLRDDFNGTDWEAVREEYRPRVEVAGSQDEFWEIMGAFIGELNDNHSRFVRPDQFAGEFNIPSDAGGEYRPWSGLILWSAAREDDLPRIWNVCEVGPAASAGLSRGDLILAVNGELIESGSDFSELTEVLFGYGDHDRAVLTVQRGPEQGPEEIDLIFGGAAGCDGWQYGLLSADPPVGYIRIPNFAGDSNVNILEAIERLEEDGPLDGLVLDVRHPDHLSHSRTGALERDDADRRADRRQQPQRGRVLCHCHAAIRPRRARRHAHGRQHRGYHRFQSPRRLLDPAGGPNASTAGWEHSGRRRCHPRHSGSPGRLGLAPDP